MHNLETLFMERLVTGLRRKSIIKPSKWAQEYRVMGQPFPGPWTFKYHPWLLEMHDSKCAHNVGQKAAQMGYTETVLNIVFFYIDIHSTDCLYILPAKTPDASDFSAARFDTALDLSPHLNRLFDQTKNIGHKMAGTTNFYLRGSRSRSGLKSVPVGVLVMDEKDEMTQENIPLAKERQSGYEMNLTWEISTPTIDGKGINETYRLSTQEEFFFQCKACNRHINLTFPDCFEIVGENPNDPRLAESYVKCPICLAKIPHKEKHEWLASGKWIAAEQDRSIRGFGVNQLYSSTVRPERFAESYLRSLLNPADEQEFYNSKLGVPHVVDGARVLDKDFESCKGEYLSWEKCDDGLVTIGIDVGSFLHYEIDKWYIPEGAVDANLEAKCICLRAGRVTHFEELDQLMRDYNVAGGVIDLQPERRKAYEFAQRYWGRVHLCVYGRGVQGKSIHLHNEDELMVTVDRTSWIDVSLGRFRNNTITVPRDISLEYQTHIKSLVRIYEKDPDGNPVGKYVKAGSDNDHLAHARTYSEIALPLTLGLGVSETIENNMI